MLRTVALLVLLFLLPAWLTPPASSLSVAGPNAVAIGGRVELEATGTPAGGSYGWRLEAKNGAGGLGPGRGLVDARVRLRPRGRRVTVTGLAASTLRNDVTLVAAYSVGGTTCEEHFDLTVVDGELTAYRPQLRGGYSPLPRTAVPNGVETDDQLGPGIRINGPGEIDPAGEDDLVEVVLAASFPGARFALERSASSLHIWTSRTRVPGTEVPFSGNRSPGLTLGSSPLIVWVEWTGTGGLADLELVPERGSQAPVALDRVRFHSFNSIVMSLGGEDQEPSNPIDPNHGTFLIGKMLYELGYDAQLYDEDNVSGSGGGSVYDEVVNAVQNRGVTEVVSFGYSHGGGSTYDLVDRLDNDRGGIGTFTIPYTSYVDGVDNSSDISISQENRRPPTTGFHANHYQNGSFADLFLDGGPVTNSNPAPTGLNVESTPWGSGATHFEVDDFTQVIDYVRNNLTPRVNR